ncbi:MAG: Flp pilus assembly complex ATPase component TadA [Chloroflexi bacterium]|nr:Flp pilus assembly complex ATPase component TadA [Chloroflexota bacterium]
MTSDDRKPPGGELGRQPHLIPGQMGRRLYSMAALAERIEAAFIEEYGLDSPALRQADTPASRLKLVLGTTDYVLAVESVQLAAPEKADLVSRVYSDLFGYGPLDALFLDERVTTIALEGADQASVRYGHADLSALGAIFQDEKHLRRVLKRLLLDAGAEMRDDQPYIETGLQVGDRPVCINLMSPPVTLRLTADIRVHPASPPDANSLIENGFWTAQASTLLKALAASSYGLIVVGEPESGKTTLLGLLAGWLPQPERALAVERAGELRLPPGVERLAARWPVGDAPGISFGEQIGRALALRPGCLLLDEVRADEPLTIAPLLTMPDAPRLIWSFRGPIFEKRLSSALGMLARRADMSQSEEMVRALYRRLPFVVTVNRLNGALRLWSVGEWQFKHSPDYPTYVPLMRVEGGALRLTGERPALELDLPESFWE